MDEDVSDERLKTWQSDPLFLDYIRTRRPPRVPLDLETLTQNTADRLWFFGRDIDTHLSRIAIQMPNLKLKVGFTEGHSFRATADLHQNVGLICFDLSVPVTVTNLFFGLLCNAASFPNVGNPISRGIIFRLSERSIFQILFMLGDTPNYIVDQARTHFANVLATTCLSFIFFHEFVHIRNGHLDLIKSVAPLTAMEEFGQDVIPEVTPVDRRVMEWDADRVAYLLSCDFGVNRMLGGPYPDFAPDQRKAAFLALQSGYYLLFRLFENIENSSTPLAARFHPTPRVRMTFIATKGREMARHMGFEVSQAEIIETMNIAEAAWSSAFNDDEVLLYSQPYEKSEFLQIMTQWNELRPRLLPLNRGSTDLALPFVLD